ncbi:hypothetical protein CHLRE_10g434001v5 [Chlamydomonas reinhardtii]|uniref:Uncharacterized protein n=1 Tax=Chlamydomonas reinhardtii TaxID=3055 RepID=A0A2K3DA21_CHLRE|nr:uncharacterized protein CHLRE_10g434001v5 [Chlamydomonas reinhardtii]XP_042920090.1 uncharacterized protein CHLRE_10g434001v5 [Chlamydomonas reinhardtii]XP_042920091.1 uncharacterized protein CHLRE_10g434001v5 [Chlamydomonas reinhardtii]PNW77380.1 hypothetical protein CHLRE_10g434001v5 [Chlamydomonas reinhardtii]PNW77381.1 hypothetical protein CHLRE_10g434001v5 [Chlamydomonas reinhardtii]PNW77382.1 hypothetical protein CHLRE_10g434001v5 [Chlamydomonas reinhardtii]
MRTSARAGPRAGTPVQTIAFKSEYNDWIRKGRPPMVFLQASTIVPPDAVEATQRALCIKKRFDIVRTFYGVVWDDLEAAAEAAAVAAPYRLGGIPLHNDPGGVRVRTDFAIARATRPALLERLDANSRLQTLAVDGVPSLQWEALL